ncbi:MAG: hypothetical protein IJ251_07145 [Oscillospiraceae bacterium]|nr:hypothetical protein [Oscillospiraceae bacterium]
MKMKKTVAGVLAGAMAVSAMAATVSADGQETISLTYDLKAYFEDVGDGKITYIATWADSTQGNQYGIQKSAVVLDGYTYDAYLGFGVNNVAYDVVGTPYVSTPYAAEVTVKALSKTDGQRSNSVTQTFKYIATQQFGDDDFDPFKGQYDYIATDAVFNKEVNDTKYDFVLPILFSNNVTTTSNAAAIFNAFDLFTLGYSETLDGTVTAAAQGDAIGFSGLSVRIWYKTPNKVRKYSNNSWTWNGMTTNANANYISVAAYDLLGIDYKKTEAPKVTEYGGTFSSNMKTMPATAGWNGLTLKDAGEKVYPFRTNLKPVDYTVSSGDVLRTDDVIYALKTRKSGGNFYTYPLSVLNDAIANNEKVTFTFTGYDGYVSTANSTLLQQWVEPYRAYGWSTGSSDWKSPTFGQHVYANTVTVQTPYNTNTTVGNAYTGQAANPSTYDQYGSYSQAWAVNLFTGAIVVNSEVTMQLNDTDKFQWGANTLSFVWQDIIEDGKITNAKQLLTSMLLYTPTEWYWDNLTVNVEAGAAEDVDNAAGLEGEGEELVEEEVEEEVVEEVEVEEPEFVEEEVEVVEEAPAPVETAPSPKTGNAPVALAVIPVALAAAAVVAKKRG